MTTQPTIGYAIIEKSTRKMCAIPGVQIGKITAICAAVFGSLMEAQEVLKELSNKEDFQVTKFKGWEVE